MSCFRIFTLKHKYLNRIHNQIKKILLKIKKNQIQNETGPVLTFCKVVYIIYTAWYFKTFLRPACVMKLNSKMKYKVCNTLFYKIKINLHIKMLNSQFLFDFISTKNPSGPMLFRYEWLSEKWFCKCLVFCLYLWILTWCYGTAGIWFVFRNVLSVNVVLSSVVCFANAIQSPRVEVILTVISTVLHTSVSALTNSSLSHLVGAVS